MTQCFQLVGIDHKPFGPLFDLGDAELKALNAQRRFATASHGFPCRISLEDAREGEELLLLPYQHQAAHSPYRASGPIFVRRSQKQRRLAPGEVPAYITSRLMSVRAYNAAHMIVAASVCEGAAVEQEIVGQFKNAEVDYIHLHNARQGCFSCQVIRA